jgi:hypothetical protein
VKLHEHQEFDQTILYATEYFREHGLRESLIEKDYYVTETLRVIASMDDTEVIFKGGTSLSKGWNLIQRFSEDIDMFVQLDGLGSKAVNTKLKKLMNCVTNNAPLVFLPQKSNTSGGQGRNDCLAYDQKFGGVGEVEGSIRLETGIASGREPTELVQLQSFVGKYLQDTQITLGCDNEGVFKMQLMHFRRTFVEKLFAIHKKVELYRKEGIPVGTHARHYYDLYQLSKRQEVLDMLLTAEYGEIKEDYERVSIKYFESHYVRPSNMSFAESCAIFPRGELSEILGKEYEDQCLMLCYGKYPSWVSVLERFKELRSIL